MRIETSDISAHPLGRDRWIGRIATLALWLGAAIYFKLDHDPPGLTACGLPIFVLGATAALIAWNQGRSVAGARKRGGPGRIVVTGDDLHVRIADKSHHLHRADIISGWTERWSHGEELVLATRAGLFFRLLLPQSCRGHRVLAALGVAPAQRARVIRLGVSEPGTSRAVMIFLAMIVALIFALVAPLATWLLATGLLAGKEWQSPLLVLVIALIIGYIFYRVLIAPLIASVVRIGTDGVVVERLWRKRLIRRSDLHSVGTRDGAVVLCRRNGQEIAIPAGSQPAARTVCEQIQEAMAETGTRAQGALLQRLDRSGRSMAVWLRDLRTLPEMKEAYRQISFTGSDLLSIVKDGGAPTHYRIAAAAALSAHDDEQIRTGLRTAASACVDDRIRIILEKAATGALDEDELERAAAPLDHLRS